MQDSDKGTNKVKYDDHGDEQKEYTFHWQANYPKTIYKRERDTGSPTTTTQSSTPSNRHTPKSVNAEKWVPEIKP